MENTEGARFFFVAGEQLFSVPATEVERVVSVAGCQQTALPLAAENVEGLISIGGQPLPVLLFPELCCTADAEKRALLVLSAEEKRFAFAVDRVLGVNAPCGGEKAKALCVAGLLGVFGAAQEKR